jgi:hypothetical protein
MILLTRVRAQPQCAMYLSSNSFSLNLRGAASAIQGLGGPTAGHSEEGMNELSMY